MTIINTGKHMGQIMKAVSKGSSIQWHDKPAAKWTKHEIELYRQLWLEMREDCYHADEIADFKANLRFYVNNAGHLIIERVGEPPDYYRIEGTEEIMYDFRPYREQGLRFQDGYNVGDYTDKGEYPLLP